VDTHREKEMSVAELPNQEVTIYDADLIEERQYWLDRLSGEFPDSFLLPDYPRPPIYLGAIGSVSISVSEPLYAQIQSLTRQSPFLLYVTLLAAFKVCLFKYSGHTKISVGSPALIGVTQTFSSSFTNSPQAPPSKRPWAKSALPCWPRIKDNGIRSAS